MELSNESKSAIAWMRHFQQKEREAREAATHEYEAAKAELTHAYIKTRRITLGNQTEVIDRRAQGDQKRRDRIGDEQFYRGLTNMYAQIAQVELALDEAREREHRKSSDRSSHDLRNAGASRT